MDEVEAHEAGIEALVKQRPGGLESLKTTATGQTLRNILIMWAAFPHIVLAYLTWIGIISWMRQSQRPNQAPCLIWMMTKRSTSMASLNTSPNRLSATRAKNSSVWKGRNTAHQKPWILSRNLALFSNTWWLTTDSPSHTSKKLTHSTNPFWTHPIVQDLIISMSPVIWLRLSYSMLFVAANRFRWLQAAPWLRSSRNSKAHRRARKLVRHAWRLILDLPSRGFSSIWEFGASVLWLHDGMSAVWALLYG